MVSRGVRVFIGSFNTVAAVGLAAYGAARPFAFIPRAQLAFHATTSWFAALAALVATIAIAFDLAVVAWVAVGYLLWIGLLAGHALSLVYLALALSLVPVVPRPQGSLWQGLAVAAITALAITMIRQYAV